MYVSIFQNACHLRLLVSPSRPLVHSVYPFVPRGERLRRTNQRTAVFAVAYVGIYGNEKADRLAKAAMERAHKATPRTAEEAQDRILEGYANDIVFACLQHT